MNSVEVWFETPSPLVKVARLQKPVKQHVRCITCERQCSLREGGIGWCKTRVNFGGSLYTLIYGAVSSISANPIEKKPFYHFHPGTRALTFGSWGCNFGCPWCQNWDISKAQPYPGCEYLSPDDFIQETLACGCQGTSISFNEPTLSLEWSLDVFQLAQAHGLYNTYVTNGYMTSQALDLLAEAGLHALNVDIKGENQAVSKHCRGVDAEAVWMRCKQTRELGLHLEISTLVIPGFNDDDELLANIAQRIVDELGKETPWHVCGYFPAYRFTAPPTPLDTLERAWKIGNDVGLEFVYIGNAPAHPKANTYCPDCGANLIERRGLSINAYRLESGRCPECMRYIPGVWV
jgi:pyruvate formate lyase activating enzyme